MLLSLLVFLSSCTLSSVNMLFGNQVDCVLANVGRKIAKKYHLDFCGIGGSLKNGKENILYLNFNHLGERITIEESKKKIVELTEEIVILFNSEIVKKNLQKELFCFPFTTNNIHTTLFCYSDIGESYEDPYIAYTSSCNDKIIISTRDPENRLKYKQEIEEPYIDAVIKYKGADYASTAVTCQIKGSEKESNKK